MSLINSQLKPFTAQAYHNGKFVTVSDADLKGKWSVIVFKNRHLVMQPLFIDLVN